ncbi:sulfatase-like hydrolase/transferase [Psychrosphaera sp. 1_MG-2023]|nr:sulfatase-like hydrolase/transferase [Psychrosphaera sp. 1_MG-2023]MDO6720757.1 sulfatase-like hydrolase/transferase [Psychrosphaera sp. 1_MG-2023]
MFESIRRALLSLTSLSLLACNSTETNTRDISLGPFEKVSKPNVVLILIDDLNHYGITAYGANRLHSYDGEFKHKVFSTPSIDSLAQKGVLVERAYAHPICENTRISLMSGKRNNRNYLRPKSQHHSDLTFGDAFKKAGYKTGLFGKWKQSRGTEEIAGQSYLSEFGWDTYTAFDVIEEGQRFINPSLVVNGEVVNYKGRQDVDPETGRRWYGPDIVNRHALRFIEENKHQPFFLYYPMLLVHDDHKPTPDTRPKSIFDNFPEVATYNNTLGDDRQYFPDMITYMDKLVGKVVNKLEEQGLIENTLIVVMGDNGTKSTFGHVLPDGTIYPGGKGRTAENGIRVPLILSQPSVIPSGQGSSIRRYSGIVNITDIYPTVAESAGVPMPNADQVDGVSFWQQAVGKNNLEHRDYIYRWYIGNNRFPTDDLLRFVFNKDYKLYAPDKDFPKGRFFDLTNDPLELHGEFYINRKWGIRRYSGLSFDSLTETQHLAYQELKNKLEKHKEQRVTSLAIIADKRQLTVGERLTFDVEVLPNSAQRQGVIWHSTDPTIATVDKFGVVTALRVGEVEIQVYSWDDAKPLAANEAPSYLREGLSDMVKIEIK